MSLIKITDLTAQLGLSSRALRYYEQAGLVQSIRPQFEKYRFYDEEAVERLRQIMVLRKMQISIRDIVKIYESDDMTTLVSVFVDKINEIDGEVTALNELKAVVNDFLREMSRRGVTKISALPLLYEEMDKQLEMITYDELSNLNERLSKPVTPIIISLPATRMISSNLKSNPSESDTDGFLQWIQINDIKSSNHERFEFQDVIILRIPNEFNNISKYTDFIFDGGLFAVINVYIDEDLGERFQSLIKSFDDNKFYEIDYNRESMLENLISPDETRELVSLLVPVKKRVPDYTLFDEPNEVTDITIPEIEAANPILWRVNVPLEALTPINGPHYRVLSNGEVEYTGWIMTRVLSTNVEVKFPFRVDIEYKVDFDSARFGYGSSEGAVHVHHGTDMSYYFGVNTGNNPDERISEETMKFYQPVFKNWYKFPKRGKINHNDYNRVTWIIGVKHIAVIVNGEIRYCGENFPYMGLDLSNEKSLPIIIGGDGQCMKYIREIKVSQLAYTPKNKFKKEGLLMITKRSNNIIPIIHRLVTDEYGENYWFNGCAKYVMECLGEKDFDYQFFAGITGDVFAQYYPYDGFRGEGVSGYEISVGNFEYIEQLFEKCGYAATFVTKKDLQKNTEMYIQTLLAYIDKGIPVISWGNGGPPVGVFVGYEEYGKTLLYITGNTDVPERISIEKAVTTETAVGGWIFVGDKKRERPLAEIYRETIFALPEILTADGDKFCFGSRAFRVWADDIENGKFDNVTPEDFDTWALYTSYICGLATNGSCCHGFLQRAKELNPDMSFLDEISGLYHRLANIWNNDNGKDLEALGGGFNVRLEVLQDKERRKLIADTIRECAVVNDEIVRVLNENLNKLIK
jgi:Predicted transcriptional regulators